MIHHQGIHPDTEAKRTTRVPRLTSLLRTRGPLLTDNTSPWVLRAAIRACEVVKMKDCPSCGAEVPTSATRCKECFHDFNAAPPKRSGGPIFLLAAFAAMAVVGSLVLWFVVSQPVEQLIHVDQESESIVWTSRYRSGIETDRLKWVDIAKIEYVIKQTGDFDVVAVTLTGERHIIQTDTGPLQSEAAQYAELMDKPLEIVDNTRGFHKLEE